MTTRSPVLGLSDSQLLHFQQAFKLSYHLNYLQVCQQFVPFRGLDVLEVGGALPASLVIDHLGCNSWTGVEAPAYDDELGAANQFHRNSLDQQQQQAHAGRYRHLYLDIENIPDDHYGQYDLIFSIACFEHIHRLPQALRVMHRCLKPGGKLFTMHSPIWSAFDGHHLPIERPARFGDAPSHQCPIFNPWEHLLLTRSQAYQVLKDRFDRSFAEDVIYQAYNSDHINRYFTEDYFMAFRESPFIVEQSQATFPTQPSREIQEILESRFPAYSQFSNNGILAVMSKAYGSESKIILF